MDNISHEKISYKIHENPMIFKKLVRSRSKKKFY